MSEPAWECDAAINMLLLRSKATSLSLKWSMIGPHKFIVEDIAVHVKKLTSPEEFERYVDFAEEVYRDNPYWVPSDKHHLVQLLGGNSGFGAQSEIQSFAAEHDGRMVAT